MPLSEYQVTGVGQAGNFLTFVERVKRETHRRRAVEEDYIKQSAISACKFYETQSLWFNQGKASIYTTPGVREYGLESEEGLRDGIPRDLISFDEPLWIRITPLIQEDPELPPTGPAPGLATFEELYPATMSYMRFLQSWEENLRPRFYAYDGRAFEVHPTPNFAYEILFDYHRKLDIPQYQFIGGEFSYFTGGGDPLEEDYSTPWLDHAEALIRFRVKADIFDNVYKDQRSAEAAERYETAELINHRKTTADRIMNGGIEPMNRRGEF